MTGTRYDPSEHLDAVPHLRDAQSADASPEISLTKDSQESRDIRASCLSLQSNRRLPNASPSHADMMSPRYELSESSSIMQIARSSEGLHHGQEYLILEDGMAEVVLESLERGESAAPNELGHRQESLEQDESAAPNELDHRQQETLEQNEVAAPNELGHRQESPAAQMEISRSELSLETAEEAKSLRAAGQDDGRSVCEAERPGDATDDDEGIQEDQEAENAGLIKKLESSLAPAAAVWNASNASTTPFGSVPSSGYASRVMSRANSYVHGVFHAAGWQRTRSSYTYGSSAAAFDLRPERAQRRSGFFRGLLGCFGHR